MGLVLRVLIQRTASLLHVIFTTPTYVDGGMYKNDEIRILEGAVGLIIFLIRKYTYGIVAYYAVNYWP